MTIDHSDEELFGVIPRTNCNYLQRYEPFPPL